MNVFRKPLAAVANFLRPLACEHDFEATHGFATRAFIDRFRFGESVTLYFCRRCGKSKRFWA